MMVTIGDMTISKAGMVCLTCKAAVRPAQQVLADAMFDKVVLELQSIVNPPAAKAEPAPAAESAEKAEPEPAKSIEDGEARKSPPGPEAVKEVTDKGGPGSMLPEE